MFGKSDCISLAGGEEGFEFRNVRMRCHNPHLIPAARMDQFRHNKYKTMTGFSQLQKICGRNALLRSEFAMAHFVFVISQAQVPQTNIVPLQPSHMTCSEQCDSMNAGLTILACTPAFNVTTERLDLLTHVGRSKNSILYTWQVCAPKIDVTETRCNEL